MPKCKECRYCDKEFIRCGRNIFYCMHPQSYTECLPHRIIAKDRDATQAPVKTAPRWCPLKGDNHERG